jgi:hypothetical protein
LVGAIWVLIPHDLVFAFRGEDAIAECDGAGLADARPMYLAAGLWIERHLNVNRDKLATLAGGLSDGTLFVVPPEPPGFALAEKPIWMQRVFRKMFGALRRRLGRE